MDRDSMLGLTEEDYGYDDDDEAFEQFGLFTSAGMFSGSGYRGYSGADVVTKPSMTAFGQGDASDGVAAAMAGGESMSGGYVSPDMALEQAVMALEEESWAAEELQGATLVEAPDSASVAAAGTSSSRESAGLSEEDYWGDEDEQALLFGFGEF